MVAAGGVTVRLNAARQAAGLACRAVVFCGALLSGFLYLHSPWASPVIFNLPIEFLRALEKADDLTIPGIRWHPVPESGREGWRMALMIAWSRLAMAQSGSDILAIFASTSLSPSALPICAAPTTKRVPILNKIRKCINQ